MSEKKQLTDEQIEKVNGGFKVGDHRIFKCMACNSEYDPDTTMRGEDITVPNENGNGYSCYSTWFCPICQKFERYTVVQVKQDDLVKSSTHLIEIDG